MKVETPLTIGVWVTAVGTGDWEPLGSGNALDRQFALNLNVLASTGNRRLLLWIICSRVVHPCLLFLPCPSPVSSAGCLVSVRKRAGHDGLRGLATGVGPNHVPTFPGVSPGMASWEQASLRSWSFQRKRHGTRKELGPSPERIEWAWIPGLPPSVRDDLT